MRCISFTAYKKKSKVDNVGYWFYSSRYHVPVDEIDFIGEFICELSVAYQEKKPDKWLKNWLCKMSEAPPNRRQIYWLCRGDVCGIRQCHLQSAAFRGCRVKYLYQMVEPINKQA